MFFHSTLQDFDPAARKAQWYIVAMGPSGEDSVADLRDMTRFRQLLALGSFCSFCRLPWLGSAQSQTFAASSRRGSDA